VILRSVTRHVREQNWFAVGIDFLIVVVGVFIGIQVANWNEAQADRRLGLDYQDRLVVDLQKDLRMLRGMVSYYNEVLESVLNTQRMLQDDAGSPTDLIKNAYRASEINYNPQTRATWDQVVSSGHIGLLPREATPLIAEYFAFDFARDAYNELFSSDYRKRIRSLIPLDVQIDIRANCSDIRAPTGVIIGLNIDCKLDVDNDPDTAAQVAEEIRRAPDLLANLTYQYSHVYSAAINSQGLTVQVEQALASLGHVPERDAEQPESP
jgi:hypothetical protein